jgi:hypothetical protein
MLPLHQPCRHKAGCEPASRPCLKLATLLCAAQTTSAAAPTAHPTCSRMTAPVCQVCNAVQDVTVDEDACLLLPHPACKKQAHHCVYVIRNQCMQSYCCLRASQPALSDASHVARCCSNDVCSCSHCSLQLQQQTTCSRMTCGSTVVSGLHARCTGCCCRTDVCSCSHCSPQLQQQTKCSR